MCNKGPVGGACLMMCILVVIYIVAYVAPAWATDKDGSLGLWFDCYKDVHNAHNATTCDYAGKHFSRPGDSWFLIVQIVASVALGLAFLSCVISIVTIRRSSIGNICYVASIAFLSLLTGGALTGTLVVFAMNYDGDRNLSFSFYMTVVSTALSYLSTLLCCVYLKCPQHYDDELPLIHNPSEVQ